MVPMPIGRKPKLPDLLDAETVKGLASIYELGAQHLGELPGSLHAARIPRDDQLLMKRDINHGDGKVGLLRQSPDLSHQDQLARREARWWLFGPITTAG